MRLMQGMRVHFSRSTIDLIAVQRYTPGFVPVGAGPLEAATEADSDQLDRFCNRNLSHAAR